MTAAPRRAAALCVGLFGGRGAQMAGMAQVLPCCCADASAGCTLDLAPCSAAAGASGRVLLVPLLCALLAAVAPRSKGATTPTGELASWASAVHAPGWHRLPTGLCQVRWLPTRQARPASTALRRAPLRPLQRQPPAWAAG